MMKSSLRLKCVSRFTLCLFTGACLLAGTVPATAQTVFFSDSFTRPNSLDLDAVTNGMSGITMTNGMFAASNVWLEPIDLARSVPADCAVTNNTLRMGGNGHAVNIVLDRNFATLMSTGVLSITVNLVGKPGPNDNSSTNRYEGVGFGFSRAEGNVVSASVDRVLSRAADLFVAETAKGMIRINDDPASGRSQTAGQDVAPTAVVAATNGATVFVPGTLRLDLTITNAGVGSSVGYAVLFDSGSTGSFSPLTNGSFILSDDNQLYVGLESRSTPAVVFDDVAVAALGEYGPPANTGLIWRAQVDNNWDTTTPNWVDATSGNGTVFTDGQAVKFDDTASNASVIVSTSVSPASVSLENNSLSYNFSGNGALAGAAVVSKLGTGTATLALANSYTGGTALNAGRLRVGTDQALGSGLLTLSSGTLSSDGSTARAIPNPMKITGTATLGDATDNGPLAFANPIDLGGSGHTVTFNSDVLFAGGITNGMLTSKLGKGTLTVNGVVNFSGASDVQDGTVIFDAASVTNTDRLIADTAAVNGIARLVITNGASVTVTTTVGNLRSGRQASTGSNYVDLAGPYYLPNADAADGNITLQANAAYSEMTLWPGGDFAARSVSPNGSGSGTTVFKFNGGILRARSDNAAFFQGLSQAIVQSGGANIDDSGFSVAIAQNLTDGGGGLNKIGSGTLFLNGVNTFTGGTVVSNGTFGGSGSLSGPLRIAPGATLNPGAAAGAVGQLTVNNSLTLDPGSSAQVEIDKSGLTNDSVAGLINVNYAGTLVVSNISGAAFASGDAFTLFNASGVKSGNFNSILIQPSVNLAASFDPATGILKFTALASGEDVFTVSGNSTNDVLAVLANDAGSGLRLLGVSSPANGTAVVSGTNILYSPNFGFTGTDSFTYTNQDSLGSSTELAVTVTVSAPQNFSDHYQVLHNSSSNALDVLRNDEVGMSLVSITQPTNGTALISGTNVVYVPNSNYIGADSFSYLSQNTSGASFVSTVSIDVRQYPNFVLVLADDQGWTGLSVMMDTNRPDSKSDYYKTPRMETLASQSMRFSAGYSPHPNCSPSRYSILTGQTCARLKMTDIIDRSTTPVSGEFKLIAPAKAVNSIQSSNTTIPELLKSIPGAGYSAAHFGKWHLAGGGPVAHGFDADANDGATDNSQGNTGPAPIDSDPKRAYSITDRALNYLNSRAGSGTPFYLQVSHYAVHDTTQDSQSSHDFFDGVPPGTYHTDQNYAGMTLDLDINVGRVLDRLDDLGIRNSTYVIYISDNGAPKAQSENYPLRGYKPEVWEGGDRVPMFIRGPGVPANSQCNVPVIGYDLFPTIWQWAGGSPTNLPAAVDGGSLVATINSIANGSNSPTAVTRGGDFVQHSPHYVGPSPWPNDWQLNDKDMRPRSTIHSGQYKLVANYEPGTIELYDLNSDISEVTNLSPTQLAIKWQLWVRLRDYLKMVNAQMPTLDPTYPGTTNGTFALAGATGSLGDADSDGLNDDWEFREMLTYQFNGNDDPDHDGVSNAEELAQGTDPLVPNAYRINTITQVAPDQLQLTWNATPGMSFAVEVSTNLVDWSPATTVDTGNDFSGSVTVIKTLPEQFFRVRKL
ncbi:MAG TPA: sulfatase-like hydrolase/transferase [Verrucomicrobiae bacterium]|nr:sulfatase-like hydrolase/transferase [Verrucomicrobiae bacterium]